VGALIYVDLLGAALIEGRIAEVDYQVTAHANRGRPTCTERKSFKRMWKEGCPQRQLGSNVKTLRRKQKEEPTSL
jgi:hypothetical protein